MYSLTTRSTFWKTSDKLILKTDLFHHFLSPCFPSMLYVWPSGIPAAFQRHFKFFVFLFSHFTAESTVWKTPWNISELLHCGATTEKNILIILHIQCWLSELRWWLLELPLARSEFDGCKHLQGCIFPADAQKLLAKGKYVCNIFFKVIRSKEQMLRFYRMLLWSAI